MAYWTVRTTLDLDDDLVAALAERYPGMSKTAAIEAAIRSHLEATSIERLLGAAGTLEIEDLSGEIRARDRRT